MSCRGLSKSSLISCISAATAYYPKATVISHPPVCADYLNVKKLLCIIICWIFLPQMPLLLGFWRYWRMKDVCATRITALGHNSLVFLYIAVKIAAGRETGITSKRRNCEKWGRCLLVSTPHCVVRRILEFAGQKMGYLLWLLSMWFTLMQCCRDAAIRSSFTGTNKAVWKQRLGRNYSASLNADAQDPEPPSGWDLPVVCVINPIRCLMSLALKEHRNEGLFPKQWVLFFKETIYISFLLKNQRKILRFYRNCKIAAPPL